MGGRVFGLILMVLAIWVGLEVYQKGVDHACGGVFAWFGKPISSNDFGGRHGVQPSSEPGGGNGAMRGSVAQQVGAKVREDLDRGARRDSAGEGDGDDND